MAASLQRLHQIRIPDAWDDTKNQTELNALEGAAVDMEDTLHGVLSQIKRILYGADSGNWYDDVTSAGHSLKYIREQTFCEEKLILKPRLNLTDLSAVPASAQHILLDAAGELPADVIAYGGSSQGAVCAQLAGAVGTAALTEITGSNALHPKNLVFLFDGATGDPITSGDRRVFGLLQVGSLATDGNAFATSGNDQGQISFVRANASYSDLELVPAGDMDGKVLVYAFTKRDDIADMPEELFRGDLVAADPIAGEISLDRAYDGGSVADVDNTDVNWRLSNTKVWKVSNGTGSAILSVLRNDTTGEVVTIATDTLDIDNANSADFAQGIKVDTGDQDINIGHTSAGQIDSTALDIAATSGNLSLRSVSGELQFTSTRESLLELDDATTGAISALKTTYEGAGTFASIAEAIDYAIQHGTEFNIKFHVISGGPITSGTNIAGAVQDITDYPIDSATPGDVKQLVFYNGRLLRGGDSGGTKHDVYDGTTPASGDLMHDFDKPFQNGDLIISIVVA